jgi:hypothetical protein
MPYKPKRCAHYISKCCAHCGEKFKPRTGNQITCGAFCAEKRHIEMMRRWRARRPDYMSRYHQKLRAERRAESEEARRARILDRAQRTCARYYEQRPWDRPQD